jgi:hypothetical protein
MELQVPKSATLPVSEMSTNTDKKDILAVLTGEVRSPSLHIFPEPPYTEFQKKTKRKIRKKKPKHFSMNKKGRENYNKPNRNKRTHFHSNKLQLDTLLEHNTCLNPWTPG